MSVVVLVGHCPPTRQLGAVTIVGTRLAYDLPAASESRVRCMDTRPTNTEPSLPPERSSSRQVRVPRRGGKIVRTGDPDQARVSLENLIVVLDGYGARPEDLVKTTVYVVGDRQDLVAVWKVVADGLAPSRPPSTLLGVFRPGYPHRLAHLRRSRSPSGSSRHRTGNARTPRWLYRGDMHLTPEGDEIGTAAHTRHTAPCDSNHRSANQKYDGDHRRRRGPVRPSCSGRRQRQLGFLRISARKVEGDRLPLSHRRRIRVGISHS